MSSPFCGGVLTASPRFQRCNSTVPTTPSAAAILSIAEANAKAIRQVAEAIVSPGGINAVNLKVAEQYVAAFANLAKTNNTLIVPSNLSDLAGLVATATTVFKAQEK